MAKKKSLDEQLNEIADLLESVGCGKNIKGAFKSKTK